MSKATFCTTEQAKSALKHRVSSWLDTDTMNEKFGVEAQMRLNLWCHVADADTGQIIIFNTRDQAKAFIGKR